MKQQFRGLQSIECVLLLLLMLAQMVFASPTQSAAFDEGYTITYGYAYLHTGDARLSRGQNPPLTDVLIALPLTLRNDITLPTGHPTWANADIYGFSDEFLWKANADPQRLVLLARLAEMALALLLASVVYAFTRALFGSRAALAALFLCVFDPNVLAHGHIVGTDLGVTLFMFSAVWMWTAALKHMSMRRAIVAGLLTGAALASKYSAVWLIPILLVLAFVYPGETPALRGLARLKLLLIAGVAAFVVIWATFGFSIGPVVAEGWPAPAPQYWESLGRVADRVEASTPAYMLGQISAAGFPLYYPYVFVTKTPLPTLILLVIGVVSLIVRRRRQDVAAWFPPLLFMLAALISGLNLGYRLILPMLPFVLMIAGQGTETVLTGMLKPRKHEEAEEVATRTLWLRVSVVSLLCLWLVVDTLSIGPNHLAYFNQFVNRDRNYDALVDANLDWGQDLIALREWLQAHQVDDINLAYFGTARPEAYGVPAHLLPSFTLNDYGPEVDGFSAHALPAGWYAISATSLQLGTLYSRWQLYAPFRARPPDDRAGQSLLLYHVDYPSSEVDRAVVLGPVAGDLDQQTLGGNPDRQLIVKWAGTDAAVLDMQGPARYIMRGGERLVGIAPAVHEALLAHGTKLGSDASGDLRLWEIDARSAVSDVLKTLGNRPISALDGSPLELPAKFEGGLSLTGYDLQRAGPDQAVELVTYWQVDRTPDRPLSIFAHMVDEAGHIVAQRDGLNVRLSTLEPGDVIMQRFDIEHPSTARAIELGLYDAANGQRMPVPLSNGQTTDRIILPLK